MKPRTPEQLYENLEYYRNRENNWFESVEDQDDTLTMIEGNATADDYKFSWHERRPPFNESWPGKRCRVFAKQVMDEVRAEELKMLEMQAAQRAAREARQYQELMRLKVRKQQQTRLTSKGPPQQTQSKHYVRVDSATQLLDVLTDKIETF